MGSNFLNVVYEWVFLIGLSFSCIECFDLFIIVEAVGIYIFFVILFVDNCMLEDVVIIMVLDVEVLVIVILFDLDICFGEIVFVGGVVIFGVDYIWNVILGGFILIDVDFLVMLDMMIIYFVSV